MKMLRFSCVVFAVNAAVGVVSVNGPLPKNKWKRCLTERTTAEISAITRSLRFQRLSLSNSETKGIQSPLCRPISAGLNRERLYL